MLNVGVMGYVEIPKINVKLPIYHGTSEDVLSRGVGHIEIPLCQLAEEEHILF